MKLRLVLAAAFWGQSPQILVLDEPANYLDRKELEALLSDIKDYKGGVLITCHNKAKDLFQGLAAEEYTVRAGRFRADSLPAQATADSSNTVSKGLHKLDSGAGMLPEPIKEFITRTTLSPQEIRDSIKEVEKKLQESGEAKNLSDTQMADWSRMIDELKKSVMEPLEVRALEASRRIDSL